MKVQATIDLTNQELLEIITNYIEDEFKYVTRGLPRGEALSMYQLSDCSGYRVVWGMAPEPDVIPVPPAACEDKPSCACSCATT